MADKPTRNREVLKQKAEHARRLASNVPGDKAAESLLDYAKELDEQAARMDDGKTTIGSSPT